MAVIWTCTKGTYVFFDRLGCKGIVDSVFASPLESVFEFLDAVGQVPPCSPKEPRRVAIRPQVLMCSGSRRPTLRNIHMSKEI